MDLSGPRVVGEGAPDSSRATAAAPEARIEVGHLERGDHRAAARMLADAFLDDPAWSAGSPRRRGHRRIANRSSFRGLLSASRRHGASIHVAGSPGAIEGVAVSFDPGRWPMPDHAGFSELGWLLISGPAPARRAYRDDAVMRRSHPTHPHLYLWLLGVGPSSRGRGVGRALIERVISRGEDQAVPVYLETATDENVAMYRRFGFEVRGEIELPSGVVMRQMERPPSTPGASTVPSPGSVRGT